MDAVPITVGQEFSGYSIREDIYALRRSANGLRNLSLGGTAVGTGINTDPLFPKIALDEINRYSKSGFRISKNRFAYMQNFSEAVAVSAGLRTLALRFMKISNDIRLLSSGPSAGIGEMEIPAVQPGSSIMPGKINPSMPEMLNMVCFKVIGNDLTISMAAGGGQLELNVFGPVIAYSLLESIEIMKNGVEVFTERCMAGITPNKQTISRNLESSAEIATAISPVLGYNKTAELIKAAVKENVNVREIILRRGIMTKKELDALFDPLALTKPNFGTKGHGRRRG